MNRGSRTFGRIKQPPLDSSRDRSTIQRATHECYGAPMIGLLERVFETEAYLTLKRYPRLSATLLIRLATLAIAVLRAPA
jgi:hypothetical protein